MSKSQPTSIMESVTGIRPAPQLSDRETYLVRAAFILSALSMLTLFAGLWLTVATRDGFYLIPFCAGLLGLLASMSTMSDSKKLE